MDERLTLELSQARTRFDEACQQLRPELHRFCTRMTGSPCDGEDVLQEALVLAFYRLGELRDPAALRGWLFRIAHNKCIDFVRTRRPLQALDEEHPNQEGSMEDELVHKQRATRALTSIASELPPKERACVVLKDILEFSLEETADVTGSNVGAVKAALHRAREKLTHSGHRPSTRALDAREREVVERYIAAFNRRDWDAVRAVLSQDAQLEVVHRQAGPFTESQYLVNYSKLSCDWKFELAWVDGVECVVQFRRVADAWLPHAVVQVRVEGDRVCSVRDYVHVPYLLESSEVLLHEP